MPVTVRFQIECSDCSEHERMYVYGAVGGKSEDGEARALPMQRSSDKLWTLDVKMKEEMQFEYRFVMRDEHSGRVRREGPMRRVASLDAESLRTLPRLVAFCDVWQQPSRSEQVVKLASAAEDTTIMPSAARGQLRVLYRTPPVDATTAAGASGGGDQRGAMSANEMARLRQRASRLEADLARVTRDRDALTQNLRASRKAERQLTRQLLSNERAVDALASASLAGSVAASAVSSLRGHDRAAEPSHAFLGATGAIGGTGGAGVPPAGQVSPRGDGGVETESEGQRTQQQQTEVAAKQESVIRAVAEQLQALHSGEGTEDSDAAADGNTRARDANADGKSDDSSTDLPVSALTELQNASSDACTLVRRIRVQLADAKRGHTEEIARLQAAKEEAEEAAERWRAQVESAESQRSALAQELDHERRERATREEELRQQLVAAREAQASAAAARDEAVQEAAAQQREAEAKIATVTADLEREAARGRRRARERLDAVAAERMAMASVQTRARDLRKELSAVRAHATRTARDAVQAAAEDARAAIGAYAQRCGQREAALRERVSSLELGRRQLEHELHGLKGSIRVFCRVRPLLQTEADGKEWSAVEFPMENKLALRSGRRDGDDARVFALDRIFPPSASQSDVFAECAPLVTSLLDGFSGAILAYGQTGSGKTHTMMGAGGADGGITGRAVSALFTEAEGRAATHVTEFTVSVLEIYNEQLKDLLSPRDAGPPADAAAATRVLVKGAEDVWRVLQRGSAARATHATNMNERSSRSHLIVCVHARMTCRTSGDESSGTLHFVDLAGSERVRRSGAEGDRLVEAQHINRSLSALADVVAALRQGAAHVPFRNSKLTRVLQGALSGGARALMVAHASPAASSASETMCTLRFASRAADVRLGAVQRTQETGDYLRLRRQVAARREDANAVKRVEAEAESAKTELARVQARAKEVPQLKAEVSRLQEALKKKEELHGLLRQWQAEKEKENTSADTATRASAAPARRTSQGRPGTAPAPPAAAPSSQRRTPRRASSSSSSSIPAPTASSPAAAATAATTSARSGARPARVATHVRAPRPLARSTSTSSAPSRTLRPSGETAAQRRARQLEEWKAKRKLGAGRAAARQQQQ